MTNPKYQVGQTVHFCWALSGPVVGEGEILAVHEDTPPFDPVYKIITDHGYHMIREHLIDRYYKQTAIDDS